MSTYVALFRGINVGKAKRIAMADLRVVLEGLGYTGVRTLLNSGNAVFETRAAPNHRLAQRIREAVAGELGVDALVVVKSAGEIAGIVSGNTMGAIADDPSRLLVAVTADPGDLADLAALASGDWGGERVAVGKHAAYVWCANGILESKAAVDLLKRLADKGTTRNWATMEKIHALMRG